MQSACTAVTLSSTLRRADIDGNPPSITSYQLTCAPLAVYKNVNVRAHDNVGNRNSPVEHADWFANLGSAEIG